MSKLKFDTAKQFISTKDYAAARRILATIEHPTAREWEAKLDALAPIKKRDNRLRYILVVAVVVVGIAAAVLWAQNGSIYTQPRNDMSTALMEMHYSVIETGQAAP